MPKDLGTLGSCDIPRAKPEGTGMRRRDCASPGAGIISRSGPEDRDLGRTATFVDDVAAIADRGGKAVAAAGRLVRYPDIAGLEAVRIAIDDQFRDQVAGLILDPYRRIQIHARRGEQRIRAVGRQGRRAHSRQEARPKKSAAPVDDFIADCQHIGRLVADRQDDIVLAFPIGGGKPPTVAGLEEVGPGNAVAPYMLLHQIAVGIGLPTILPRDPVFHPGTAAARRDPLRFARYAVHGAVVVLVVEIDLELGRQQHLQGGDLETGK